MSIKSTCFLCSAVLEAPTWNVARRVLARHQAVVHGLGPDTPADPDLVDHFIREGKRQSKTAAMEGWIMNEREYELPRAGDDLADHLDFLESLVATMEAQAGCESEYDHGYEDAKHKVRAELARTTEARTKWREAKDKIVKRGRN